MPMRLIGVCLAEPQRRTCLSCILAMLCIAVPLYDSPPQARHFLFLFLFFVLFSTTHTLPTVSDFAVPRSPSPADPTKVFQRIKSRIRSRPLRRKPVLGLLHLRNLNVQSAQSRRLPLMNHSPNPNFRHSPFHPSGILRNTSPPPRHIPKSLSPKSSPMRLSSLPIQNCLALIRIWPSGAHARTAMGT